MVIKTLPKLQFYEFGLIFEHDYIMKPSNKNSPFTFSLETLAFPLYFVLFLWLVFWFETTFGYNFAKYGLYPKSIIGLRGIFISPFLHSDLKHLFNNSVPLFVLGVTLFYFYKKIAYKVLFFGTFLLGLLTWFIGRESYHIGASGIVYLLFSFIFFSGIFSKYYRLTAVSLMVIFLYGSMIWYLFPIKESISWEGHTSGFIIGILFAVFYRNTNPKPFQYDWQKPNYIKDDFDNRFDENGNYIPPPPTITKNETEQTPNIEVSYHFIKNKEEE